METSRCSPAPSEDEAAAIIAAVERFLSDTTPAPAEVTAPRAPSPWKRAALAEGVARRPESTL